METEAMFPEEPIEDHIPAVNEESDAQLEISPSSGRPGTDAILTGRHFPPETMVELTWYTQGGAEISGSPVGPSPRPDVLPAVTTDESGSFQIDVSIPTDIGATRPILANVYGEPVASTGFVMQPEAVDISPTSGPLGTEITIAITGVGWRSFENQYFVLYDNKPMGYVVSDLADSEGIVRFSLRASGEPGYHFIDLIPMFHDTESMDINLDQKPHLSYVDNHPERPLPSLNFAFRLTEE